MKFQIDYIQFKPVDSDDSAVRARSYGRQAIAASQIKRRVWNVPNEVPVQSLQTRLVEELELETGWGIKCMRWERVSDENLLKTPVSAH